MADDTELTELFDLDVMRQDGVKSPANGWEFIIQKDVNAVGGIDEKPDIKEAESIIQCLGRLIEAEARELQVCPDETYDLHTLMEALCLVQCFRESEMWSDEDDGSQMAKSVDGLVFKAHRKFSSDERKSLAAEGKALPDGSYPIPDEDALRRAAILARSGHGDVAGAKRLISKRAKELGVANPLAETAQKDVEDVETPETPDVPEVEKSEGEALTLEVVAKMIADANAETVTAVAKERDDALAELAVLKATPIPGGPVLSAPASVREARATSEALTKALYHERQAVLTRNERELSRYHTEQAKQFRAQADPS